MGFGTYDESEQERQEVDTEEVEEDGMKTGDADHDGDVEFNMEDTDAALDRLDEIKDNQPDS